jgi:hypothetical protein
VVTEAIRMDSAAAQATREQALTGLFRSSRPETGTVTVSGAGSLNFTPASAPTCTARYESVTSRNSTMDATLATGSCGRLGGANDTWIRIN